MKFLLLCLALLTAALPAADYALPASNQGQWLPGTNVGVNGGIAQYQVGGASARTTLIDVTQSPYNADNTGATDCSTALYAAIAAATSGQVVYLPAGTYKITSQVSIHYGHASEITLRGAGKGQTYVYGSTYNGTILGINGDDQAATNPETLSGTKTKGTSNLTVGSSTGYSVGDKIILVVENEEDNTRIQAGAPPTWTSNGFLEMRQMVCLVTAVPDGTHVTIDPPLPWDCTHVAARIEQQQFDRQAFKIGIEDMTIDFDPAAHPLFGIQILGGVESWISNVEFGRWYRNLDSGSAIRFQNSYKCEIRRCHGFSLPVTGSASDDGFIQFDSSTSCLVEDNYALDWEYGMYENGQTVNNFIGYNYLKVHNNLVSHNAHPSLDLYEGNVTPLMQADGYHGSSSGITWYRNWLHGSAGVPLSLAINRFNRQMAIVGNVLGTDGVADGPISYGNPFMGNGSYVGSVQPTSGTFWTDWKTTGTLTTRTSDSVGVVTVSGGNWYTGYHGTTGGAIAPVLRWNSRVDSIGGYTDPAFSSVTAVSGNLITMNFPVGTLPAVSTPVDVFYTVAGWYEQDLDVEDSSVEVENYASEGSGTGTLTNGTADTLPASMAYPTTPPWWTADSFTGTYPPVEPNAPDFSIGIIPAGVRAGADPPSDSPPVLTNATIGTSGTAITFTFTESVSIGAGGNAGWVLTLSTGSATATYSSGAGTNSLVYTLSSTVDNGTTGTLAYTQPTDGLEDGAGNDLVSLSGFTITNNSTQGDPPPTGGTVTGGAVTATSVTVSP